jgi:hypothetical protein
MEPKDAARHDGSLQMDTNGQMKVTNSRTPCFLSFSASTTLPLRPTTLPRATGCWLSENVTLIGTLKHGRENVISFATLRPIHSIWRSQVLGRGHITTQRAATAFEWQWHFLLLREDPCNKCFIEQPSMGQGPSGGKYRDKFLPFIFWRLNPKRRLLRE